jgi:GPN-loop GTPase
LCRAELDKRRVEKQRLEEEGRKENMVKFRKDAEKSSGETVVLSTGLKEKRDGSKTMMDEADGEIGEEDEDDHGRFAEDEDFIDEDEDEDDEDEEVARFSF